MSQLDTKKLCFIGGGMMAEALIRGLVTKRGLKPSSISVLDNGPGDRLNILRNQYGIVPVADSSGIIDAIHSANMIVLAVKPKDAAAALTQYRGALRNDHVIVSFVAGLAIGSIADLVGFPLPIVRTMPNTSSSIGFGATGLSCNAMVGEADKQVAIEIFESIGIVSVVDESLLDIVTGVSGSGPAYIYYVVESMIAGGVAGGLDEDTAKQLTIQTVLGAAEMLRQTGETASELRRKVTSPGGTTQAALELMAGDGVGDSIKRGVLRAAERAGEMGREIAEEIKSQR